MSKTSFTITPKAYYKMMLHCMKHTSSDCYGLLLGKVNGEDCTVEDVVPFSHDKLLAPAFELCVKMIKKMFPETVKIIGLYENTMFNQMKSDCEITNQAVYVSELIHKNAVQYPFLVEIHSKDDGNNNMTDKIFVRTFRFNERGGFDDMGYRKESEDEYKQIAYYLNKYLQNDVIDFDDHLMDANADWRNQWIA